MLQAHRWSAIFIGECLLTSNGSTGALSRTQTDFAEPHIINVDGLLEPVKRSFIFENYIVADRDQWLSVGRIVQNYLSIDDKVFDLSSGPCGATAIAQVMGCQCAAVDFPVPD